MLNSYVTSLSEGDELKAEQKNNKLDVSDFVNVMTVNEMWTFYHFRIKSFKNIINLHDKTFNLI